MKQGQNCCLAASIICTALCFVALLVINYLSANPDQSGGLFIHGTGNVSAMFELDVTPAGATFAIWGVIYAWQLLWIIYSLVSICRSTPYGPAYNSPVLLPLGFFIVYVLNLITNVAWLIVWDRLYITVAAVILFLTSVTLYICIGISYKYLADNTNTLENQGRQAEIKWMLYGVQNGLAMYAAWVSVATLLNFGSVLAYKLESPLQVSTASTVVLSLLSVELVAFVVLDLSILNKFSQFVFTPYIVIVIALVGVISKNWNPTDTNSIFSAVLLGVAGVFLVVKLVNIFRGCRARGYTTIRSTLNK